MGFLILFISESIEVMTPKQYYQYLKNKGTDFQQVCIIIDVKYRT